METIQAGEQERLVYELHAWVVMPNHVHLLILPKVAVPVWNRHELDRIVGHIEANPVSARLVGAAGALAVLP